MIKFLLCVLVCSSPLAVVAQTPARPSVESRIATQNALFAEQWEQGLRDNPERATSVGDYRYNDRLSDYTSAHVAAVNAGNQAYLARLTAKKELGRRFDLRKFHDEMLSGGSMPLDLLDARTNAWIAAQKAAAKGM